MKSLLFGLIFVASTANAGIVSVPQLWHCLDVDSTKEAKVTDGVVLHMDERDTLSVFTMSGSFVARGQLTSFGGEIYGFDWAGKNNDVYGIRITPSKNEGMLEAGVFYKGDLAVLYICN